MDCEDDVMPMMEWSEELVCSYKATQYGCRSSPGTGELEPKKQGASANHKVWMREMLSANHSNSPVVPNHLISPNPHAPKVRNKASQTDGTSREIRRHKRNLGSLMPSSYQTTCSFITRCRPNPKLALKCSCSIGLHPSNFQSCSLLLSCSNSRLRVQIRKSNKRRIERLRKSRFQGLVSGFKD